MGNERFWRIVITIRLLIYLLVLFANTGNEHPYTYSYRDRVIIPLCKEHNIEFVSIESHMGYHGKNWDSLTTRLLMTY